jgi:hypothetical protein
MCEKLAMASNLLVAGQSIPLGKFRFRGRQR